VWATTLYEEIRIEAASGRNDEPMDVMAMKYQFLVIPAKTFSFCPSRGD
jgi:hypothetical protein